MQDARGKKQEARGRREDDGSKVQDANERRWVASSK
jgi:hypothetical protein